MKRLALGALCVAALLFGTVCAAPALDETLLSNKSGMALNLFSASRKGDERPFSVNMSLANNASTKIPLITADMMTFVFGHAQGKFTFPNVPHYGEAKMELYQASNVPMLAFIDAQGTVKRRAAGVDSRWKFPQVLGFFPYGVGTTSMAEAIRMGAKQTNKPQVLLVEQQMWKGIPCRLSLVFDGTLPGSRLKQAFLAFPALVTDFGIVPALRSNGYVCYSSKVGDKLLPRFRMMAEGRGQDAIDNAFKALFPGKGHVNVLHWYGPPEFVKALMAGARAGKTYEDVVAEQNPVVLAQWKVGGQQEVALYKSR